MWRRGSHAELLGQGGSRYAAMWAAQEREARETGEVSRGPRAAAAAAPAAESLAELLLEAADDGACGCGHAH